LLRGGEMLLCPRCNHIVPDGEFCNQCGQHLSSIALHLRQLVLAGDAFWVTSQASSFSAGPSPSTEAGVLEADESVPLANAKVPDWLQELPTESVPTDVAERIYPTLRPIGRVRGSVQPNRFFTAIILLTFVLMIGLVSVALFFLLHGGG
jgi:hypothetical protein